MRDVFSHPDHARVGFLKSVLENAGIPAFLKNDASFNTTELTSLIIAPTLSVINDEDFDRARLIVQSAALPPPNFRSDWKCPACGEEVPGNFDACWKCGAELPVPATVPAADA
jgi:hypothetical protein